MRIALISDLHSNAVALRTALGDIEREGVDRLVCLGDVATLGPRPVEVIELLRRTGCDCVMGNHDAFLLDPELIHGYTDSPEIVAVVDWSRRQLSDEDLTFLATFRPQAEISADSGARLLCVHGSPRSHSEDILATTSGDELEHMLDGHRADVVACGHTHIQMLRQHRGTLIVNPGSVGGPFQEYVGGRPPTLLPFVEYAVVELSDGGIEVTLRRIALDTAAVREDLRDTDNPMRDWLLQQYS
jgi:putative phosphoesterase